MSAQVIRKLPPAVRDPDIASFVSVLSTVFVSVVPVVLRAFGATDGLTGLLLEIQLLSLDDTSPEQVEPVGSI